MLGYQYPTVIGFSQEVVEMFKAADEHLNQMEDFCARMDVLASDVKRCGSALRRKATEQFWRRALVRTLLTFIEGHVYGLKRLALENAKIRAVNFAPEEMAILREESYYLKENGRASTRENNFPQLIPNFKFAHAAFARAHGADFQLDESGLKLLEGLGKVRNNITHPKRLAELEISDVDCVASQKIWEWVSSQFVCLVAAVKKGNVPFRDPPKLVSRFDSVKQVVLLWPDGTVYGFDDADELAAFLERPSPFPRDARRAIAYLHTEDDVKFLRGGESC